LRQVGGFLRVFQFPHLTAPVGFEFLDDHYQYYHNSSYRTRWDTRDNVCLDLQDCRYLIYTFHVCDDSESLSDNGIYQK
jgi:hypothetical protein